MGSFRFNAVVDRFVDELRNGKVPRIEAFLNASTAPRGEDIRALFYELLCEELYYTRQKNGCLPAEAYRNRFPQFSTEIQTAFAEAAAEFSHVVSARQISAEVFRSRERSATPNGPQNASAHGNGEPFLPEIPGFEILQEISRGGMGVVYKARQKNLDRTVAIKVILSAEFSNSRARDRFRVEAAAQANLQHSNIVQVFESGAHLGHPYLCMEFIHGCGLNECIQSQPMSTREAARLVEKLARAIEAAHELGIVHRDLKPSNILMTADGEPKITDFGLAKRMDSSAELTQSGAVVGTPGYMAPEQAAGNSRHVGPLADVYGLGAILYELLTSRPPFSGKVLVEVIRQVAASDPVAPSAMKLKRRVPSDLETICLKCLEKDPSRRYSSALGLADDLGRFLRNEVILARGVSHWERALKWRRRNVAAFWLIVTLAAAAIASGLLTVNAYHHASLANQERARSDRLLAEFIEQRALCAEALNPLENEITRISKIFELPDEVRRLLRQTEETREVVAAALSVREDSIDRLGAGHGANSDTKYRLSDALIRSGSAYYQRGGYAVAVDKHRKALETVELMPHPVGTDALFRYKLKLAAALSKLGVSLGRSSPAATAAEHSREMDRIFSRALALRREAAAAHPDSLEAMEAISYSLNNLADQNERHAGGFKESLDIRREILKLRPADRTAKLNVAVSLNNCCNITASRNIDQALEHQREAVKLCESLVREDPDDTESRFYLGQYYLNLGKRIVESGQLENGMRYCTLGIDEFEKCRKARPLHFEYSYYAFNAQGQLANTWATLGNFSEAIAAMRIHLGMGQRLRRDGHPRPTSNEMEQTAYMLEQLLIFAKAKKIGCR